VAAYIIVDVEVQQQERYAKDYLPGVPATMQQFGGRFIVRGGKLETLEGEWQPHRMVVIEFPDVEKAKAWWSSQEYGPLKTIRQETAKTNMILVEGA
jgi:uncharacterized protein (DUF1330 family)